MQARGPDETRHQFDIFADYHQVYLEDCQFAETRSESLAQEIGETPEQYAARMHALAQDADLIKRLLSPEARARHLGIVDSTLCILTASMRDVPVTVELHKNRPADEWADWDRVVEASISLPSGCLMVSGPTDYLYDAPRIALAPGTYRARVHYGGIATVSADELDGDDRYMVMLWPAPTAPPQVLHDAVASRW